MIATTSISSAAQTSPTSLTSQTYPFRFIVSRENQRINVRLDLTLDQASGIILTGSILTCVLPRPIRWGGPSEIDATLMRIPHTYVLFVSSVNAQANILPRLLDFDPTLQSQHVLDIITSSNYTLRHRPTRRYIALFRLPDRVLVIEFDTLEFLQGMVTACNWAGINHQEIIPLIYDGTQPMTMA